MPSRAPEPPAEAVEAQPTRLTFGPGLQTDASWSPDGRRIAFVDDRDGNFDVFTQSIDGGEPVRITRTPANETHPTWSPDGQRLALQSDEDGGGLFRTGRDGGAMRRIAAFGSQPAWMPDGRDVLFGVFAGDSWQKLFLTRADGGETPCEILANAMAKGSWLSFAVHPDGRIGLLGFNSDWRLGFYVSDREHRTLHLVTDGRQLRTDLPGPVRRAFWGRRGDVVYVEALDAGAWTTWRVPIDPATERWGKPVRLTTRLASGISAAVSPDGRMRAFTKVLASIRAWVFLFDANSGTPPGEGRPVTDEDAVVQGLSLQEDGKAVLYRQWQPGRSTRMLIRADLDTGQRTVLLDQTTSLAVPSPRGSGIAYTLQRPSNGGANEYEFALAWRSLDGRERLLSSWSANGVYPTDIRRDDRAVLWSWARRTWGGPIALVEWPIGTAAVAAPGRVLLDSSTRQFWQGRYSPDGRWVSFVAVEIDKADRLELGLAPADGASTWTRIAADHPWPDKPRWSSDGRTLYFLSRGANGLFPLWGVRIDSARGTPAGEPFQLTHFDSPRWHIEQDASSCEMGIAAGRLVLPMETVSGSIWLLAQPDT